MNKGSSERQRREEHPSPSYFAESGAGTSLLEVRDLQVHFETDAGIVRAVDGVSFTVDAGETLAVVGESGSGKSVSMLALAQLIPRPGKMVAGSIRLEGTELRGSSERELKAVRGKQIGIVFQDSLSALNPVLTVERQLSEAIRIHQDLGRRPARARALELLEMVGISGSLVRANRYPHQLSGGMRQRVMIAMAIANEPAVLIADEPTTALDVTVQAQILELLDELCKSLGMALLLVTHDLGIAAEYADRVLVIYAGKVVEYGEVGEIFGRPLHPYTAGLLASVPSLAQEGSRLKSIAGQPPSLSRVPDGCAFHPRCPCADEICSRNLPVLTAPTQGARLCSCHFAGSDEDPSRSSKS